MALAGKLLVERCMPEEILIYKYAMELYIEVEESVRRSLNPMGMTAKKLAESIAEKSKILLRNIDLETAAIMRDELTQLLPILIELSCLNVIPQEKFLEIFEKGNKLWGKINGIIY